MGRNKSTKSDKNMQALCISDGKIDVKCYPELLSIVDDIIIKGQKIAIPRDLRKRVLGAGHEDIKALSKQKCSCVHNCGIPE